MKKMTKILASVFLALALVACSSGQDKEVKEAVEDYLEARADLYEDKDEILEALGITSFQEIDLVEGDGRLVNNPALDELLEDLRATMSPGFYQQLLYGDQIINGQFLSSQYQEARIKDLELGPVEIEDQTAICPAAYTLVLDQGDQGVQGLETQEEAHHELFFLEKVDKEWRLFNIQ